MRQAKCSGPYNSCVSVRPEHLDLRKREALVIRWSDGRESRYPITYLRRMSPSAETRKLREELSSNPLTVLPAASGTDGPLEATGAELVGNYAVRITFSDGHQTGLYSWDYLRRIDPAVTAEAVPPSPDAAGDGT